MKKLYQAHDRFMFRTPTAEETEILYTKEEVLEACRDKAFLEKIEIASPALVSMMDFYIINADKLAKKKKDDFFISVQKDIDEISVRCTKVFELVQSVCHTYKSYKEIYQVIRTSYPDVEEKIIETYLNELMQKQILISNLRPPFTSGDQLEYLKQQCEMAGMLQVSVTIEELQRLCQEYENTVIGEGVEKYREIQRDCSIYGKYT